MLSFLGLIYYKNIGKGAYRKVSIKYDKLLDMLNRKGIGKVEICGVLKCQPGDSLEYQPDEEA